MDLMPYILQFAIALAIGVPLICALHWLEIRRMRGLCERAVDAMVRLELERRQAGTGHLAEAGENAQPDEQGAGDRLRA